MIEDATPYDTAEVCRAAGLAPKTLDSWLLRRALPLLPPGPGTGRSRRYSLLDVTRVCAAAELVRQGISIGIAGRMVGEINGSAIDPATERRTVLIVGPPKPPVGAEGPRPGIICTYRTWEDIELMVRLHFVGATTFTLVDITAIGARTRAALEDHSADMPALPAGAA